MRNVAGFGQPTGSDAYWLEPESEAEVGEAFALASSSGRSVAIAGAQRSYGDAMEAREGVAISLNRLRGIGELEGDFVAVEGGATLEDLWRHLLPLGRWPYIVSGTAKTTLAGAIAMNIHGKNAFKAGTFEDAVAEVTVVLPTGERQVLRYGEPDFHLVCGGAGLFGAIVSARVRTKPIASGGVMVTARAIRDWREQIACFEEFAESADSMVSWVDMFGGGRGLFHAASYTETPFGLDPEKQLRTGPILGVLPRSQSWRAFKLFNHNAGMRLVNAAKHGLSKVLTKPAAHPVTLAEFNFLLDAAPGWERAYAPHGLLQFQAFVPKDRAVEVFSELERMQRKVGLVSNLGVLKRHRPSKMFLDYSVDGYSLALDIARRPGLDALVQAMTDFVIEAGGRFYLAKDSSLTPEQFRRIHGMERVNEFIAKKKAWDPEALIRTELARRLEIA